MPNKLLRICRRNSITRLRESPVKFSPTRMIKEGQAAERSADFDYPKCKDFDNLYSL